MKFNISHSNFDEQNPHLLIFSFDCKPTSDKLPTNDLFLEKQRIF